MTYQSTYVLYFKEKAQLLEYVFIIIVVDFLKLGNVGIFTSVCVMTLVKI